jgi:hypothetical protein
MLFPIKIILKVISSVISLIVLYFVVTLVQVWMTGQQHSLNSAQAIVVLGAAEYNGTPSSDLAARLGEAYTLYKSGRAPLIAVTGGNLPGDAYTEAGVSATYLRSQGVPSSAIIQGSGADTYQNIQSIAPQLKARGVSTLLVVTDSFHEDRSMAIASTFGFRPYPSPTTTSPIQRWSQFPYYLRETVAVGVGRITGYSFLSNERHLSPITGG